MDHTEGEEIVVTANQLRDTGNGGGWGGGWGGWGGSTGGWGGDAWGGDGGGWAGADEIVFQPEEPPTEPPVEDVVVTADPLPYTAGWDGDQYIVRAYDFANGQIHVGSVSDAGTFVGEQPMTPEAAWDALPSMIWPGTYEQIA